MMHAESMERAAGRLSFALFLGVLAFTPYYIIAHFLLGQPTLLGKSIFLALVSVTVIGLFVWHAGFTIRRIGGSSLLVVWVAAALVVFLRFLIYGNLDAFSFRFAFLVFVYGFVALPFTQSPWQAMWLRRVLLWSCILQAVLGIIHSIYFPYVVTGIEQVGEGQGITVLDPGQGGFRESGTLISANTFGAFLVLGLILLFAGSGRLRAHSMPRVGVLAGILWWGLILSGSRYAIAGGAMVSAYFLIRSVPRVLSPLILAAAAALFFSSDAVARIQSRFAVEGSGGRVAKTALAVQLATEGYASLLIGVRTDREQEARTSGDLMVSDNSYASMVLDYGLPFTLLLLCCIALMWSVILRADGWVFVAI
jgi:hypothetical protein